MLIFRGVKIVCALNSICSKQCSVFLSATERAKPKDQITILNDLHQSHDVSFRPFWRNQQKTYTTWDVSKLVNNGENLPFPQLVSRIFSINNRSRIRLNQPFLWETVTPGNPLESHQLDPVIPQGSLLPTAAALLGLLTAVMMKALQNFGGSQRQWLT